jgi:hypothetical protein
LNQDLESAHGAVGEPTGGNQNAEDVPETGRGNHLDVFDAEAMLVSVYRLIIEEIRYLKLTYCRALSSQ